MNDDEIDKWEENSARLMLERPVGCLSRPPQHCLLVAFSPQPHKKTPKKEQEASLTCISKIWGG